MHTMNHAWQATLEKVLDTGRVITTRGKRVIEVDHHTVTVNMNHPVLWSETRKLNYKFMAAEAAWIISGSDSVAEIGKYNPRMFEFSDDGLRLAGAYGVRFSEQFIPTVDRLLDDPNTRQATMTLWRPELRKSKDMPCTVAMDFKIREGMLNAHVFMRSSDVWLGLPYDVFSFSMMACNILEAYKLRGGYADVNLGVLYLTAASSHLYEEHWLAGTQARNGVFKETGKLPPGYHDPKGRLVPSISVRYLLEKARDGGPGSPFRWWEPRNT